MKLALALLLIAAAAPAQEDSPLVKAAKAGGGPKKKSLHKVITNEDVKKSTGKLVVLPAKATASAAAGAAAEPQKGPLQKQDELFRARKDAIVTVDIAAKKVAELESELRRLEQAYYEENDPNYRDTTIEQRFNQTRRQLEAARKELADARDAQERLNPR